MISGQGGKITHASWLKNTKQKQYCNTFNKDFYNGPHQKKFFKKIYIDFYMHYSSSCPVNFYVVQENNEY